MRGCWFFGRRAWDNEAVLKYKNGMKSAIQIEDIKNHEIFKTGVNGIYKEHKKYCIIQDVLSDIQGISSNIEGILFMEIKIVCEEGAKGRQANEVLESDIKEGYKRYIAIVVQGVRNIREVMQSTLKDGMGVDQYLCGIGIDNRKKQMRVEIARAKVLFNKRYVFQHIFSSTSSNSTVVISVDSDKLEQETLINTFDAAIPMERELYDMIGLNSVGNNQIRRILTDYGFKGHPLRKDFPTTGFVESRFDANVRQVISKPVKLNQAMRDFDNMGVWSGEAQRNTTPNTSILYKRFQNTKRVIRKKVKEYKQEVKVKGKRIKESWSELVTWRRFVRDGGLDKAMNF